MNYRKTVTAALLSTALLLPTGLRAQETAPSADTIVATVNGVEITLGHIIAARMQLPSEYDDIPEALLWEGLRDQLVQQELLKQANGAPSTSLRIELDNAERATVAGAELRAIADRAVTEEMLTEAYNKTFAEFEPGREYHAAHILVESEEEAKALIEELDGGADFAALAREKSTGPSGPNGGDLGWFGLGMMVPEFETAVVTMDVGTHSAAPVQTQFGWHVIDLKETRLAAAPTLDEVRDQLAADLQETAIREALANLEEGADVDVVEGFDPSLINMTDLLAD